MGVCSATLLSLDHPVELGVKKNEVGTVITYAAPQDSTTLLNASSRVKGFSGENNDSERNFDIIGLVGSTSKPQNRQRQNFPS
jgi:hypothetical protein